MNMNDMLLPPHSIESEQAVLGALLRVGADALDRIEGIVSASDFYNDGLGLIVVDYLQLMKGPGENRTQEVGGISRSLKALAKELRVPVIALAQINRGVESRTDKRPQMSDLRESGDIEADADVIMMLHRNDGPEWQDLISLVIRKNRNGALGEVALQYDAPRLRFSDYLGQPPRPMPAKRSARGIDQ